ncbi:hypothetical protein L4174_021285 [Photobacterium sp. CCB-ST2H9]|uniref:DUF6414 family protein n=1 Tax=Photobacterium sp. CCB-ST2H9 TaxID=2912855 RepID=UPI002002C9AF|nr:hypothetical protein [Photobacterium sp. CCB-ST2H9]UTM59242.1 hypothetical protein L4174_021285 [Photobacterium sp. CCB-ST2H9]
MIKNFIYLDEPKLYSYSSQLFEGVTEFVLNEDQIVNEDSETSKQGVTSGRVIADVIRETSSTTSKKFLHDHSFNIFETELLKSGSLINVANDNLTYSEICASNKSFVRIRAQGKFVDIREIQYFLQNLNETTLSLIHLKFTEQIQYLEKLRSENSKSNEFKKIQSQLDKTINQAVANQENFLPEKVTKSLVQVLNLFGDDIIRFQQTLGGTLFSSCLNNEHLRDSLKSIYRKYSRKTAKDFIVLGAISNIGGKHKTKFSVPSENDNPLAHIYSLAENMYDLEQTFGGRAENEIIIEPIAIYTEL